MLEKDEEILERRQMYFTWLMNEDNPRQTREEEQEENLEEMEVIREDEVKITLKKTKTGKLWAPTTCPSRFGSAWEKKK